MKRLQFKSNPTRKTSEALEREFITAYDRVLHADYPNPERLGCPGSDVLRRLATSPETFACQPTLQHLGRCAPCVDELKEFRSKMKTDR
jgi:hypothetical protein